MYSLVLPAAESAFTWYLAQTIVRGRLTVRTPTQTYIFPADAGGDEDVTTTLTIHDATFFLRVLATPSAPDLAFAEAYMRGDVSFDSHGDLVEFFKLFIMNRDHPSPSLPAPIVIALTIPSALISVPGRVMAWLLPSNPLFAARENIRAHYDLGNDMFKAFLSLDMTYSCAIFPALDADMKHSRVLNGQEVQTDVDELHEAQIRKLNHIIHKADIRPGHRVLEIGSGWGSMALLIARSIPDTIVDTITLSIEQAEHVTKLIEEDRRRWKGKKLHGDIGFVLPVGDRVRIHVMDFRSMPQRWAGVFDRVISVEMVEAIGKDMYERYFAAIDWALKRDVGVGVVQGITIPEGRYDVYAKSEDFINKYSEFVFPGGILPTLTHLTSAVVAGSSGRLLVESVANVGPHYARTLREWRKRFESNFGDIEQALKDKYPEVMNDTPPGKQEIATFRRKWIYYFCYCEAGFTTRTLADHIITFTREGNAEYGCQIFQ